MFRRRRGESRGCCVVIPVGCVLPVLGVVLLWWFNRKRSVRRQVAEYGPEGRIYRNKFSTVPKPMSEWIAVPVPDSGIPREVVDRARAAIRDNRRTSSSKRRF